MFYFIVSELLIVVKYEAPYKNTEIENLKNTTEKIKMIEMSKPIFNIYEVKENMNMDDRFESIELNEESKKYIHVQVNNIVKTYDSNSVMTKTINKYNLTRCSENFFTKTDFEEEFYHHSDSMDYCMENDEVYLEGTRDS